MNDISPTIQNDSSSNNPFSVINPSLQIFWDSTAYDALCKCPRYYQYRIIHGYGLDLDENPHILFGQILHAASETYDKAKASGATHEEALLTAFRFAINETWDSNLNRPWTSYEPTKTRKTLLRTIVWYLDNYKDDNLKTYILSDGRPAVELPFRFGLGQIASTREEYQLCGYLDKVVSWNDELWISDIKTTKYELDERYFSQYTPNNQISLYSIAGQIILRNNIDGVIIDGIQTLVNGNKFRRKQIARTPDALEEWLADFWIKIYQAETYAENNYWPQEPKSCGFGSMSCQFRTVCSADASARTDILENFYIKRIWNPLLPR